MTSWLTHYLVGFFPFWALRWGQKENICFFISVHFYVIFMLSFSNPTLDFFSFVHITWNEKTELNERTNVHVCIYYSRKVVYSSNKNPPSLCLTYFTHAEGYIILLYHYRQIKGARERGRRTRERGKQGKKEKMLKVCLFFLCLGIFHIYFICGWFHEWLMSQNRSYVCEATVWNEFINILDVRYPSHNDLIYVKLPPHEKQKEK